MSEREEYPTLIKRQCGGWLARGRGWAITADTKDEAIAEFERAKERHRRIDAQPFLYERLRADSTRP